MCKGPEVGTYQGSLRESPLCLLGIHQQKGELQEITPKKERMGEEC